ncbi:MAG: 5'-methylthioadenosine phosphorylase [Syntrophus sp. (in: bacteria)]|nr:5'-methylthioadenosine phosphorylase [Syntrophus sp. (in: bacteria)]
MKKQGSKTPVTAIIGGTSLMNSTIFSSWKTERVKTAHGTVQVMIDGNTVFLQRHGEPAVPPHKINHKANIEALKNMGVDTIIAINSVGSLKTALKPGSFMVPDDFISIWHIDTFFDKEMRFMVPGMDKKLGKSLYNLCKEHTANLRFGGIYIQTIGPRLETKAEIRMLKGYGHIIGMTMASEATLSMEYDIPYTSLCSIDNYCNGIVKIPLTMEKIQKNIVKNIGIIEEVIKTLIEKGIP